VTGAMNSHLSHIKVNPWWIALSVMLGTFMEVLDTSIANVSLQHIAGSLSVSAEQSTWVITTYLISNAIVIPSTTWFGQRFGRKRFLITCVIIFTIASFFSGLATSLPMLLFWQVVMGAGGGALQPIAQTILFESFPKEKHGQAMAVYGLGIILAPILGPVLGGWITDNSSWRWIFFINIPVGVVAVMLMQAFIHDPPWIRNAKPPRLDVVGFCFMSLWLGCQEVMLDKGQEEDWFGSRFIVVMAALAVTGFVVFLIRSLSAPRPFIDLHVFKNRNFTLGMLLMFLAGVALYGTTVIIPLFLQSLMGYNSLLSGYSMVPRGLGAMVAMPLAGRLVNRVPGRYLVAAGFLIYGMASISLSGISLEVSPGVLFWPVFFTGMGIGFIFVPLNTLTFSALAPEAMGNASGIFNLMRNLGGSMGIAMVTTLIARRAQEHQTILAAHLTPYDPEFQAHLQVMTSTLSAQSDAVTGSQQALGTVYGSLLSQANLLSYLDNFRFFAVISFACLLGTFLFKHVKAQRPPPSAH
jgi:DHA2 family multidrug resistance protein